jgi:sporulation protein YlmC with PRC-barrel domain
MTASQFGLVPLGDSNLVLANGEDDVRGMPVLDPDGHRIGEVHEIVVDEEERRARLLVVASGGVLGLGKHKRLVPVDAVARVDDAVHLHHSPDKVQQGAEYDPALADAPDYFEVYAHYGYTPFWHGAYPRPYFHDRHSGL